MHAEIKAVLDDPGASFWLKHALSENLQRDPLDAAHDAERLADLLGRRADDSLTESFAMLAEEDAECDLPPAC